MIHWLGNVRLFYMLMLKWASWAACAMEWKTVLLLSILLLFLQLCRLIRCRELQSELGSSGFLVDVKDFRFVMQSLKASIGPIVVLAAQKK